MIEKGEQRLQVRVTCTTKHRGKYDLGNHTLNKCKNSYFHFLSLGARLLSKTRNSHFAFLERARVNSFCHRGLATLQPQCGPRSGVVASRQVGHNTLGIPALM